MSLLRPNLMLLVGSGHGGISDSCRGYIWKCLGKVHIRQQEQEGLYKQLLHQAVYIGNNDHNSGGFPNETSSTQPPQHTRNRFRSARDIIERDVRRTFRQHWFFHDGATDDGVSWTPEQIMTVQSGHASLRRILLAYSVYDKDVGYCQGMNFIAAMLLTVVEREEDAFWMLVAVMNDEPCRMRGLFVEELSGTHKMLYVAEKVIQQFVPQLAHHFKREGLQVTMYATGWLLTQYTSTFSSDLVYRVWDCYLSEGWKVTYQVLLSLLQNAQNTLLNMSFEEMLIFLRDLPQNTSGNAIVDQAMDMPLRSAHIEKFEKEWEQQISVVRGSSH